MLSADRDARGVYLRVETDQTVEGCPRYGVLATPHDRRVQLLHDAPFGHRRVRVAWVKRVCRCHEPACPVSTFTEQHALAAPRARLARRAVVWAAHALAEYDTTVAAMATLRSSVW
jgi:transposase